MRSAMDDHVLASREDWTAARLEVLAEEKALMRQADALAAKRRAMPWTLIEKTYVFDAPEGRVTLSDLFAGRSQLAVYHFMFGPDWKEGCHRCSFWADNFDGIDVHLAHRDTTFIAASNTSRQNIEAYKMRMGWRFKWVSALGSDFNRDFHVSFAQAEISAGDAYYNFQKKAPYFTEMQGLSVFAKLADGRVAYAARDLYLCAEHERYRIRGNHVPTARPRGDDSMDELGDASTTEIHRPHEQGSVPKVGQFLWHLLQMVLAMAAGMAIYVALFRLILTPDGYKAMQTEQPFLWYFEMAPFMTVPMVALMRHHGYRWGQCTEMSAAMLIPPAGLIALVQVGVAAYLPWLSPRTLPESTHIAMLLGMLAVMLHRRAEYSDNRHHHSC